MIKYEFFFLCICTIHVLIHSLEVACPIRSIYKKYRMNGPGPTTYRVNGGTEAHSLKGDLPDNNNIIQIILVTPQNWSDLTTCCFLSLSSGLPPPTHTGKNYAFAKLSTYHHQLEDLIIRKLIALSLSMLHM